MDERPDFCLGGIACKAGRNGINDPTRVREAVGDAVGAGQEIAMPDVF